MQVKNSSGEDTREGVYVTSAEDHELAGSKGTANFVIKWVRDARNQANLNVVEEMKKVVFKYTGALTCCARDLKHESTAPGKQ